MAENKTKRNVAKNKQSEIITRIFDVVSMSAKNGYIKNIRVEFIPFLKGLGIYP